MELNDHYRNVEEEESSLLKRLIALKKQLAVDDKPPKLLTTKAILNTKENMVTNKNVVGLSKFKYRKVNNYKTNKLLSTKVDNRNLTQNQNNIKQNNLSSKAFVKTSISNLTPIKKKTVINKTKSKVVNENQNIEKYKLEVNEIVRNSHVTNGDVTLNRTTDDAQSLLTTIDKYMTNVKNYLISSKYVVHKEDVNISLTDQTNNSATNVYVNKKFQNQLISNSLLDLNCKTSSALLPIKKSTIINKKKPIKRLSEKLIEPHHLVKIGSKKLIRQSLIKNKLKINNTSNYISKSIAEKNNHLTLQCSTSNICVTSNNKTKWTNPASKVSTKILKSNSTNKLKWTRPNILLVNNVNNNNHSIVQKSDKLILFGKNKIIRQSLISSTHSKTKNYLLKHLTHRFALLRKLQQKTSVHKIKNTPMSYEQVKRNPLLKKTTLRPAEIKKNEKKSYSKYSYINPILRSKINPNIKNTECSSKNIPRLHNISNNKFQHNLKIINNDKNKVLNLNLVNNKNLDQFRSKKTLTKQLCLVFNRSGICSKSDEGKCEKRHYKKYVTLCTKFLTGECSTENCTLSHIIVEEKIPFCKHYLNSICVQLNCPYLHEYRDAKTPICKNFLHGCCTLGKKCPKKHLNLCPIFESKNNCPHGQKCLYPHNQSEEKINVDGCNNEPRYFEMTIPNTEELKDNETIHIVPKRHVSLMDLPSFIPL